MLTSCKLYVARFNLVVSLIAVLHLFFAYMMVTLLARTIKAWRMETKVKAE